MGVDLHSFFRLAPVYSSMIFIFHKNRKNDKIVELHSGFFQARPSASLLVYDIYLL
jgi:hypothetical protein